MGNNSRLAILAVWCGLFLSGAWAIYGLDGLASLGFSPLLGGVRDYGRLWIALFQLLAGTMVLAAVGWAVHSLTRLHRKLPFVDFLLLSWPALCGVWVSLQRGWHSSPGIDRLAILEPVVVSILFPVLIVSGGGALLALVGNRRVEEESDSSAALRKFLAANVLGAPLFAGVLFLMALAGWWRPVHLWMLSGLFLFVGAAVRLKPLLHCPSSSRSRSGGFSLTVDPDNPESESTMSGGGLKSLFGHPGFYSWGMVFMLLLGMFQLCWLPPDDSDELRYHLAFPKRYLEAGGFVVLPDQLFSYFPTGMDLLMGLPQSLDWLRPEESRWGLVSGGKFVHAWMAWLCAILLLLWNRDLRGVDANVEKVSAVDSLAPLLLLSIPFSPILASWAFVDFGSAFGWLASAYFGWRFFFGDEEDGKGSHLPRLAGAAVGWSLMVKYTGLAWAPLLGLAWIAFSALRGRRARSILTVAIVSAALFAPWLLNNLARTGNPVAPMLSEVFGFGFDPVQKAFYDWHAGMKGDLNGFRDLPLGEQVLDLFLLPLRAALEPGRFENNPIGGLIPLLLPCFLFGFGWRTKMERSGTLWIVTLAAGCFLLWGLTYRDPRFAIPFWALYILLVAQGWRRIWGGESQAEEGGSNRNLIPWFGWAILLFLALSQSEEVFRRLSAFGPAIRLEIDREDYLAKRLPSMRVGREVERLRREEPTKPNLLLLGQEQSYYLDSPLRGADYFDGPLLAGLAREATEVEGISRRLFSEGIDWIFVNRETLELHPANRARGWWFALEPGEGAEAIEAVRKSGDLGHGFDRAERTSAYRRMHAWLIRHPGYREVPLNSASKRDRDLADLYRPWMSWPEMEGVRTEDLPRTGYSLLVRE